MPLSRTYQCLSCQLSCFTAKSVANGRRLFHKSPSHQKRKRTPVRIPAKIMRNPDAHKLQVDTVQPHIRPYTAREKQLLALKYTPQQMSAIEAGEKTIDTKDLTKQGRFRTDPMRIDYIDDFATVRPIVDFTPKELAENLNAPLVPGGQTVSEAIREKQRQSQKRATSNKLEQEEEDPHMVRLMQQTGYTKEQIRRIRVKNLVRHRVVNQTRMGKIQSQYYLTIAGNQDGMLGIGEGKAAEDEDARRQAMMNAIRNMKPIPRYEERTIYGEVEAKVGASIVKLSARPPGFGNRCQHLIFELGRAAGIHDLAARTPRSRNKMNVVKAAFEALTSQRLPQDVARARGRKMIDVRGVYYGGLVH